MSALLIIRTPACTTRNITAHVAARDLTLAVEGTIAGWKSATQAQGRQGREACHPCLEVEHRGGLELEDLRGGHMRLDRHGLCSSDPRIAVNNWFLVKTTLRNYIRFAHKLVIL